MEKDICTHPEEKRAIFEVDDVVAAEWCRKCGSYRPQALMSPAVEIELYEIIAEEMKRNEITTVDVV